MQGISPPAIRKGEYVDIKTLAGILLAERLISTVFILIVINKQRKLFKLPILGVTLESLPKAIWARRALFALAFIVLVGNFIPIVIDYLTIANGLSGRTTNPSNIGIAYAVSNATTSVFFSLLVWGIYKLAEYITLDRK